MKLVIVLMLPLSLLLVNYSELNAQFAIGNTTQLYIDAERNNREIPTILHYPAENNATDATPVGENHPLIIVGHGFAMTPNAYINLVEILVPLGYVVALPATETSIIPAPSPIEFGRDIHFLANFIRQQAAEDNTFFLFNKVGSKVAISGHSMGGGSAMLAAGIKESDFDAYIGFASAEMNPSAVEAAGLLTELPLLLFSGTNDGITPPANHQDLMYNAANTACKLQVYITGGGHCYFANPNVACDFGESLSPPGPSISREKQQEITGRYLIPWLNYHLKASGSISSIFELLESDDEITYRKSCTISSGFAPFPHPLNLRVFPNPANDRLFIDLYSDFHGVISIYSMQGKLKKYKQVSGLLNSDFIDLQSLPNGTYIISAQENSERMHTTIFVKQNHSPFD